MKTRNSLFKNTFLSLATALLSVGYGNLMAQSLHWGQHETTSGDMREMAITKDASGNIYTIGQFKGSFDVDPSSATQTLTSTSTWAVFVTKKSSTGALIWAYPFIGTGDCNASDIEVDANGNIYIAILRTGVIDMDPSSSVANFGPSNGSGLVAKYNSNMQFQWGAMSQSGNGTNINGGVAIDAAGNVYCAGYYREWFIPGGLTASGFDAAGYIMKYNSSGAHQWTRSYLSPSASVTDIKINSSGNVVGYGYFSNNVRADYRSGSGYLSHSGTGSFITELTAAGSLVRFNSITGSGCKNMLMRANKIGATLTTDMTYGYKVELKMRIKKSFLWN